MEIKRYGILPYPVDFEFSEKKKNNLLKKLKQVKEESEVILSQELEKILEGKMIDSVRKGLFFYCIPAILQTIMEKEERKLEEEEIYVLAKEKKTETIEMIYELANKCKSLHIVTNHVQDYKIIEEDLYRRKAISITISNNKRKALKRAKYIVNLDWDNELIQNYQINRQAILLHTPQYLLAIPKGFDGIILYQIEIEVKEEIEQKMRECNLYPQFKMRDLYRTELETERRFSVWQERIIQDEIKVKKLIGKNGEIERNEWKRREQKICGWQL